MEEPGTMPAGAPHRLVHIGIPRDHQIAREQAARRCPEGGEQDRRQRQQADDSGEHGGPAPSGRKQPRSRRDGHRPPLPVG